MEIIRKFYRSFEDKFSSTLRIIMVTVIFVALLSALYSVILGTIMSNKEAEVRSDIAGLEYSIAKDILFNKQQELVEEEEVADEGETEEVEVESRIQDIHKSISLHFKDENANKDQFKDDRRGLTAESLEKVISVYASGRYRVGDLARSTSPRITMPQNTNSCSFGLTIPSMNKDQIDQMIDQLRAFWKTAEAGSSENKSKFNTIKRFDLRLGTVYLANDLYLCEFSKNQAALSMINSKIENEVAMENMAGQAMRAGVLVLIDTLFKFFAAFAIVLLTLILFKIERSLKK